MFLRREKAHMVLGLMCDWNKMLESKINPRKRVDRVDINGYFSKLSMQCFNDDSHELALCLI